MTDLLRTPVGPVAPGSAVPHALWRWAGALGLTHVLLMLGALAVEGVAAVEHGTAAGRVQDVYGGLALTRVELGSYAEAMAFVVLVPSLVLFARLFGNRGVAGTLAAQVFLALGIAYVASTLAVGFPPLSAAAYAAHHGAAASTVAAVNDIRNYAFVLQIALSAAMALALGIAAVAGRTMSRWTGWGGIGFGVVGLLATPFAHNAVSLAWLVWWVGVAVLSLRRRPAGGGEA